MIDPANAFYHAQELVRQAYVYEHEAYLEALNSLEAVEAKNEKLWELACDMLRCIHANGCDGCEWFKDDECSLHLAERYEKLGIEVG